MLALIVKHDKRNETFKLTFIHENDWSDRHFSVNQFSGSRLYKTVDSGIKRFARGKVYKELAASLDNEGNFVRVIKFYENL
jgi:hypothetical protein